MPVYSMADTYRVLNSKGTIYIISKGKHDPTFILCSLHTRYILDYI